jgi:hypothetical protein
MTLDFVFKKCTGKSIDELSSTGDLDWYDKYADPRRDEPEKGILVANWNHFPRLEAAAGSYPRNNWAKGRKFQDILERMGYALEWSDQVSRCDNCYHCIETEPDSYGWTPQYHIFDGYIICAKCIREDPDDYLNDLENDPNKALTIYGIDLEEHGYTLVEDRFEAGLHPGQNDNPRKIFKRLQERGYDGLLFKIDSQGQFDTRFSVYAKSQPRDTQQEESEHNADEQ